MHKSVYKRVYKEKSSTFLNCYIFFCAVIMLIILLFASSYFFKFLQAIGNIYSTHTTYITDTQNIYMYNCICMIFM